MFSVIYIEKAAKDCARAQSILQKLPLLPVIEIEQYGEIFNRSNQNFRLQKQKPALILAQKHGNKVLPTPPGYGFEHLLESGQQPDLEQDRQGYYFSHMLNCVYDCRYCFLQGMYRSANYVLYTNFEDFTAEIIAKADNSGSVFYSGYDCDSLALEPISGFCDYFLPVFARLPKSVLEIRTKSTQVRSFLEREPMPNCVIAMSFSPEAVARAMEHKVPAVQKRIDALGRLQQAGWPVALRFEPVIASEDTLADYKTLFEQIFRTIDPSSLHSSSLGEFRLPVDYYKRMVKLYPHEPLLARETVRSEGTISLATQQSFSLQALEELLFHYINEEGYYRCA